MIYFRSFQQLISGTEVFVAMPMGDTKFASIWTDVYIPAIKSVGLIPFRVDIPQTGDSIPIEILSGIRRARLVLADITPDNNSGKYPNANVMYELGIAHSMRLPETVIVVRRKRASIPFDISHLRVLDYHGSDTVMARNMIGKYLANALTSGRLLRDELIESAWSAMNPVCRDVVAHNWYVASGSAAADAKSRGEDFHYPRPDLFAYPVRNLHFRGWNGEQVGTAFSRLLEFGFIEAAEERWDRQGHDSPRLLYRFTRLGEEAAKRYTSIR